jgi:hypothetical protein
MSTPAVARGCGSRAAGGVYAEAPLGPFGQPIEFFLCCPPRPVVAEALGLSSVGVKLIERNGVWHLWDIVGQDGYPNVADFVEEIRRFGVSRRLPRTLDFSKLSRDSRLVLLHRKAVIGNPADYYRTEEHERPMMTRGEECFAQLAEHDAPTDPNASMCGRLWWQDVQDGQLIEGAGRFVKRTMPSFAYYAEQPPQDAAPRHSLGVFGVFPVNNLALVEAPDGSHQKTFAAMADAGLPTEVVEE